MCMLADDSRSGVDQAITITNVEVSLVFIYESGMDCLPKLEKTFFLRPDKEEEKTSWVMLGTVTMTSQ